MLTAHLLCSYAISRALCSADLIRGCVCFSFGSAMAMVFLFVILCWIAGNGAAVAAARAMFVFGDSLVDAGTNVFIAGVPNAANFDPYGETFFLKPTGRFSNGKIVPDFLAGLLGLALLPPFLKPGSNFSQGANFASSGSEILDSTNNPDNDLIPLNAQVRQFQEFVKRRKPRELSIPASIFLLVTGSNDLLGGYLLNGSAQQAFNPQQYVDLLLGEYQKSLLALHRSGARKIVITGIGPLGCTPSLRLLQEITNNATGCLEESNELALAFNTKLAQLFQELTKNLTDAKIILVKPYDFFLDMINNGTKYGFEETQKNCCGGGAYNAMIPCGRDAPFLCHVPSKYLFWDFHPTHQAARFISDQVWGGAPAFVEPLNLRALAQI
ncbi:GDSL esterase/lipase 6 [Selaginella moellendorffii]|nr:GDSL esterase/lipase 6 [Selaginella moellendorffii]|eukprot:XP_002964442.2 GDSL esterase/lipase 6 [Selaginella moellendorffii]